MSAVPQPDFSHASPGSWSLGSQGDYGKSLQGVLFAMLVFAPLFMGGRYAVGQFAYAILAGSIATLWALQWASQKSGRWCRTGIELPLLAAVSVVMLQTTPLPEAIVSYLNPALESTLPMWHEGSALGWHRWSCVSTAPHETVGGLVMLASYGIVFLVLCQVTTTLRDVSRLVAYVAAAAGFTALVGVVQYLSRTDRFLWLYEHPFRSPLNSATAGFDNHNHFAHLIALGIGPVVWWLSSQSLDAQSKTTAFARRSPSRRSGITWQQRLAEAFQGQSPPVAVLALLYFGGLLSMSRGGIAVIGLATVLAAGSMLWLKMIRGQGRVALACGAALIVAALSFHGIGRVSAQLDELATGSVEQLDSIGARRAVWKANLAAFGDHWILGTGVGTHQEVVNRYLDENFGTSFSHAESGYLQVATEAGTFGLVLLLIVLIKAARWVYTSIRHAPTLQHRALALAVGTSLIVSGVHAIWDFVWYIPATMMTTAVLLAAAWRLARLTDADGSQDDRRHSRRPNATRFGWRTPGQASGWIAVVLALVGSVLAIGNRLPAALASPAWDRYLRASVANSKAASRELSFHAAANEQAFEQRLLHSETMLRSLRQVLEFNPRDPLAHARYASRCEARFEMESLQSANRMPLNQIAAAAHASKFPTQEALDQWLSRAVGPSRSFLYEAIYHARCAVHLNPLLADSYLQLSDLVFLRGGDEQLSARLLDQAARVYPLHGDVLLSQATLSANEQNVERVVELWKKAYAIGPNYRRKIVDMYAAQLRSDVFLEIFKPDLDVLRMLHFRYRQLNLEQHLAAFRPYYTQRLIAEAPQSPPGIAARMWLTAHNVCVEMGDAEQALACCQRASELRPHDFQIRRTFGRTLLQNKAYEQAVLQLQWCADRRPGDASIRRDLQQARAALRAVAAVEPFPAR